MKRILTALFAAILLLSSLGTSIVFAEGGTVKEEGTTLPADYEQKTVTLTDDGGLYHHSGTYETLGENGNKMQDGPYTAKFAVDYYGTPLTAEVTVALDTYSPVSGNAYCKAYIDSANLLQVGWYRVNNAKVKWDISLYDKDGDSYLKYFLIGFMDPDESDYTFAANGRKVFYEDAPSTDGATSLTAATYYLYNGGFVRSSSATYKFSDAKFVVSVPESETKFTFYTITPDEGALQVPYLYTRNYKITYDLNDATGTKATPAEGNPDSYASSPNEVTIPNNPSRTGYKFLGWKEVYADGTESADYTNIIPAEASGDKHFKAYWEVIKYNVDFNTNVPAGTPNIEEGKTASGTTEAQPARQFDEDYTLSKNGFELEGYKFLGWSLEEGEQSIDFADEASYNNLTDVPDATVTLYAQWEPIEYLIKYDPNKPEGAPEPTGTMNDDDHRKYDVGYNLTGNAFAIDGYDFLGWSTTAGVHDVEYKDKDPYKNLVNTDGSVVTMYAQWQPWTYTIKYDANGGKGNMPDQIFHNDSTEMRSVDNTFTRDGYRFTGFDYIYQGTKYHLNGTDDFVEKLKALGHYGEVTLVAQWEKIPEPIPTPYIPPVTGIE